MVQHARTCSDQIAFLEEAFVARSLAPAAECLEGVARLPQGLNAEPHHETDCKLLQALLLGGIEPTSMSGYMIREDEFRDASLGA